MHIIAACFLIMSAAPLSAQSAGITDSLLLRLRSWYPVEPTPNAPLVDTAAFNRTREAMDRSTPASSEPPNPVDEYRLVWVEHREGHRYTLLPGDGRSLATFLQEPPLIGVGWPILPGYLGDRYAVFGHSPPTGLIRYEFWYFERVE